MITDPILLPLLYLPPISYFSLLKNRTEIGIEKHENFVKSTGRNRCYLSGPNGKLRLSIPIKGGKSHHALYKEIQIDNEQNWKNIHWQSLCSCYRRSPYFEYYEDQLYPFYHEEHDNLFGFNYKLFLFILDILEWDLQVTLTSAYEDSYEATVDLRNHPHLINEQSLQGKVLTLPQFQQVFEDRVGFIPNLSIVDLIFNEGPNAASLINQY